MRTPPEKNSTLAFVPQRVLAYYWTNTLDLPAYWKMYLEGSGRNQEKIDGMRETAKRQFGRGYRNHPWPFGQTMRSDDSRKEMRRDFCPYRIFRFLYD